MAVYTPVSREQIIGFLEDYELGTLESFKGIEQGVSNTNYHLFTDKGRYILTLFEPHRVDVSHLDFFLSYAAHLAEAGVPSAKAVQDGNGNLYGELANRPAAIMTFCEGLHPAEITPDLCFAAGELAALMHLAGEKFGSVSPNDFGFSKWESWLEDMSIELNDISFCLADAVKGEIIDLKRGWPQNLPGGAIHADLFPDNVFFKDGKVSGVIDFHFACTDMFAYDLAIVVNAWCFDKDANYVAERHMRLIEGYEGVRPLEERERKALPVLLRGAAMRFLLSRCEEFLAYEEGDMVKPHDPHDFIRRLEHFQGE